MLVIPLLNCGSNRLWNYHYLVRTLLLLATILRLYQADDWWEDLHVQYEQLRFYSREPREMGGINVSMSIKYIIPTLMNYFPGESSTCLPIGDYRNSTVGYAVCNTDPSDVYIEKLAKDMIIDNITSLSVSYHDLSGIKRSIPRFHCIRFSILILDQEGNVRASNLTTTACPKLSVTSLLYPHPNIGAIQIDGLPLKHSPSNATRTCPVSSNLNVLYLRNNGLTSTPFSSCPTYFNNLVEVLLEDQRLRLDDEPLFPFPEGLIYLSLHRCALDNLPESTFVGLINLQVLKISDNRIPSLQEEVFLYLPNLIVLRLDNNLLTTFNISVFQGLKSLQYLYLSGNYLNRIDGEFAILPCLRVIDLSNNQLTMIRKNVFRDSPMLTIIELNVNCISKIESEAFFNMTSFKVLNVITNILTYVNTCSWFDAVTKVDFLLLAYNNITNVEGLQCVSQVRVLNLFHNKLSSIPPLRNFTNLHILDFGHNTIHDVSGDEFIETTHLTYLFLDGGEVLRLGILANSSSIETLYLQVNNLTYIPAFCFNGLQSLQTLNLSYNYIKEIGAFAFPVHLQELGLSSNELSHLDDTNQNFPQLRTLEICDNNLTQPSQLNIYLPSVVYFDISENPLEHLSLQLCKKMPALQDIFLENLGIGQDGKFNSDLFERFGIGCTHWRHVSLARNQISKLDKYSMLHGVTGGIDYSHNPLKSIPMYPLYQELELPQRYIYFNNCSIETIVPMAFQYLPILSFVDLRGNNLKDFPKMSQRVIQYDLRNNPIVCSCHLRWLHGHPERRSYLFDTCMDPITGSVEFFDLFPPDRLLCQYERHCARGCVCFGLDTSTTSIVNCSSRSHTTIPPGLPPEANIIYLGYNQFNKLHFPSDMHRMAASQLFLQHTEIRLLGKDLFVEFHSLQMIDLSHNELEALNMDVFHGLHDLRKLFLHGNRIHQIDSGAAGYDLPNLQIITLHENELEAVPASLSDAVGSTSFTNLTLAGNPWQCTECAGPILRKWLAQHAGIVSDATDIQCNESHLLVLDINMHTLEYAYCVNTTHTLTNAHWGITAGLTVSLVLLLISLVLSYCFRDHIMVLLYNKFDFLKRRRQELDVLYDVRIIYDETDERIRQWVVGELLQVLEAEWGLNVFLVERDMLAGGNHAEEIAKSIRQSRRTLIVVSQNFIDNEWAQFAYQAAFQFQIENNLHRVLVVAWEPVEIDTMEYNIKVYFETRQVMWRASQRFWPVLKSKLPLGREDEGQNPDDIQLNMIHND